MNRLKRLAQIEALSIQRGLTADEVLERRKLESWRAVRLCRLPHQIAACEARLAILHRELGELA